METQDFTIITRKSWNGSLKPSIINHAMSSDGKKISPKFSTPQELINWIRKNS